MHIARTENTLRSQLSLPSKASPVRTFTSRSLFEGAREVRIAHEGQEYRLRITGSDKLILTK